MGYVVIIDHNNGYVTYYEHNGSLLVSAGQTVYKGQQIAKAGRSGVASGVHCHFGIQRNGSYVNPLNYLRLKIQGSHPMDGIPLILGDRTSLRALPP